MIHGSVSCVGKNDEGELWKTRVVVALVGSEQQMRSHASAGLALIYEQWNNRGKSSRATTRSGKNHVKQCRVRASGGPQEGLQHRFAATAGEIGQSSCQREKVIVIQLNTDKMRPHGTRIFSYAIVGLAR